MADLKRTPLFEKHVALKGRMVPFAGFEMAVQFAGVIEEHRQVRHHAGLFDVSHMGEFFLTGVGAEASIEKIITNSTRGKGAGGIVYSPMCNTKGGILDDLLVYKFSSQKFLVVVNASNISKDFLWMRQNLASNCSIENQSEAFSLIALQGPKSLEILQPLVRDPLDKLKYYNFIPETRVGETMALISRTGYTGEDGFEIMVKNADAPGLFEALLAGGAKPCGLGCRDTLRLEAGMCLYGNDIHEGVNPFQAGLQWTVKMDKGDFNGKDSLKAFLLDGETMVFSGLDILDKPVARKDTPILEGDRRVGVVTSGAPSPTLGRNIAMGYLPRRLSTPGTQIHVGVRDHHVPARVVALPFYKRIKQ